MKLVHRWQGRTQRWRGRPPVWVWCETPKGCETHTAHRGRLVPGEPEVP